MNTPTYKINVDFGGFSQENYSDLLSQEYQLLGFNGANAAGLEDLRQIGIPTWFSVPVQDMFERSIEVHFQPTYKVFISFELLVAAGETVSINAMSDEIPLGSSLAFNADGTFSSFSSNTAPTGTISLSNLRESGTKEIMVGLASQVNGTYSPFSIFYLTPETTVNLKPKENVCLFLAPGDQDRIGPGVLVKYTFGPACILDASATTPSFELEVNQQFLAIKEKPGTAPVEQISGGVLLSEILDFER